MGRLETTIEIHRMRAIACEQVGNKNEAKDEWYLCECLIALKDITDSGDCNICARSKECKYAPKVGQMVRYNCPFYLKTLKEGDDKNDL